jgi:hypothetical protein
VSESTFGPIPNGRTDTFSLQFTRTGTGGPQSDYDLVIRHGLFGIRRVVERAVLTSNLRSASTGEREFWTDPRDANTGESMGLANKWWLGYPMDPAANYLDCSRRAMSCYMSHISGYGSFRVTGNLRKI